MIFTIINLIKKKKTIKVWKWFIDWLVCVIAIIIWATIKIT